MVSNGKKDLLAVARMIQKRSHSSNVVKKASSTAFELESSQKEIEKDDKSVGPPQKIEIIMSELN